MHGLHPDLLGKRREMWIAELRWACDHFNERVETLRLGQVDPTSSVEAQMVNLLEVHIERLQQSRNWADAAADAERIVIESLEEQENALQSVKNGIALRAGVEDSDWELCLGSVAAIRPLISSITSRSSPAVS